MSLEDPNVFGGSKYPWWILVSVVDLGVLGRSTLSGEPWCSMMDPGVPGIYRCPW